jgi:hypothetical protein
MTITQSRLHTPNRFIHTPPLISAAASHVTRLSTENAQRVTSVRVRPGRVETTRSGPAMGRQENRGNLPMTCNRFDRRDAYPIAAWPPFLQWHF